VATLLQPALSPSPPPQLVPPTPLLEVVLRDRFHRTITDLRISLTDRCNFRCVYCRTGTQSTATPCSELPLADHLRMARVFVSLGIEKIRLTGGEPLLRSGVTGFVRSLAQLPTPSGRPLDIAITTNGYHLAPLAQPLRDAGLSRVTISMDAVSADAFTRITRVPGSHARVVAAIRAAVRAGLSPVKVNCVLMRGWNDDQIPAFAQFSRDEGVIVRFIEFMPLEEDRVWSPSTVVPLHEVEARLQEFRPFRLLPPNSPGETARRYTFDDGVGEIGIIAPVSQAFCGACSRIRLTADGQVRTCLFSHAEHDLYGPLHRGASDNDLADIIRHAVSQKEERHHIGEPGFLPPSRTMVQIGG
jgi:cyclic pyranopterin phosphate synthase